jgi:hypothetical protein
VVVPHTQVIFTLPKCITFSIAALVLSLLMKKIYEKGNKRLRLQSFYILFDNESVVERGEGAGEVTAGEVTTLPSPPLYFPCLSVLRKITEEATLVSLLF